MPTKLGLCACLLATLAASPALADQKIKIPPPERAGFGLGYLSLSGEGIDARTGAGLELELGYDVVTQFTGKQPGGIGFFDSLYAVTVIGMMTSEPILEEGKFAFMGSFGYQFMVGLRRQRFAAFGGLGVDWGAMVVGGSTTSGLSWPLCGRGEVQLGGARLAGQAWLGLFGDRTTAGVDVKLPIGGRWRLGAVFSRFDGPVETAVSTAASDQAGFMAAITIGVENR